MAYLFSWFLLVAPEKSPIRIVKKLQMIWTTGAKRRHKYHPPCLPRIACVAGGISRASASVGSCFFSKNEIPSVLVAKPWTRGEAERIGEESSSWRDFARECFCFGSEAVKRIVRGLHSWGNMAAPPPLRSPAHAGYAMHSSRTQARAQSLPLSKRDRRSGWDGDHSIQRTNLPWVTNVIPLTLLTIPNFDVLYFFINLLRGSISKWREKQSARPLDLYIYALRFYIFCKECLAYPRYLDPTTVVPSLSRKRF